jgi:hypothetical protein
VISRSSEPYVWGSFPQLNKDSALVHQMNEWLPQNGGNMEQKNRHVRTHRSTELYPLKKGHKTPTIFYRCTRATQLHVHPTAQVKCSYQPMSPQTAIYPPLANVRLGRTDEQRCEMTSRAIYGTSCQKSRCLFDVNQWAVQRTGGRRTV